VTWLVCGSLAVSSRVYVLHLFFTFHVFTTAFLTTLPLSSTALPSPFAIFLPSFAHGSRLSRSPRAPRALFFPHKRCAAFLTPHAISFSRFCALASLTRVCGLVQTLAVYAPRLRFTLRFVCAHLSCASQARRWILRFICVSLSLLRVCAALRLRGSDRWEHRFACHRTATSVAALAARASFTGRSLPTAPPPALRPSAWIGSTGSRSSGLRSTAPLAFPCWFTVCRPFLFEMSGRKADGTTAKSFYGIIFSRACCLVSSPHHCRAPFHLPRAWLFLTTLCCTPLFALSLEGGRGGRLDLVGGTPACLCLSLRW